ncbi:helix-turn-helix domain-containing protein [Plebeiibacterium sediminum]|uniref:Helix-turn-helix domain-containing protein n=1 Tax=Plebeiibacterium sediminum TaxID=2992112 RepID=A0AAE3M0N6_9BACT|nr:helix-turn-helix transcriptional regulator [Plebeiobacterium sediminum]MCW3784897.1 helix-turn-helix domain-containing protein [Plebeiobacterium sediminum]
MHQGEELKRIRKKRRIKMQVIADAIGIKPNSLHYLEATETLQYETLKKYCKVLNIPITHFHSDIKDEEEHLKESSNSYETVTHVGKRISELRKQKRFNVSDFAAALGYRNRQSVYSMEKRAEVDFEIIKKVSEILDVSLEDILGKKLLNTLSIQPQEEEEDKDLYEKDKKIMSLQEKIIELQDEVNRLNKLLNLRK